MVGFSNILKNLAVKAVYVVDTVSYTNTNCGLYTCETKGILLKQEMN